MILLVLFLIIISIIYFYYNNYKLLDKNFYNLEETFPYLKNINKKLDIYKKEINNLTKNNWIDWVEKDLYKRETPDGDWKIIPFFGFNIWVDDNCNKCPELYKFLKSIPNLKIALLSRMGPNTVLSEHKGWANHSNFVLRCHFGFDIPDNCHVSVGDYEKGKEHIDENIKREVKKYKQDKWIIFDDSKFHYTWNHSNKDRIVLILDIERPKNVKIGKAEKGDTKELKELIEKFKNIKNSIN
jgi:aspartyl/asparaginyl beta-hydroxylase (cupin superfamily)